MATSVEAARQSSRPLKAIGIFGGAFSPFHNGHLRLAIEALERLQLDQVRLVPTAHPMHRAEAAIPAQKRLDWIRLAIEGERRLVADDCEVRREGPSYTVETLAQLAEKFPKSRRVLLIGADAFSHFHTWHRWPVILDLAELVVVKRPRSRLQAPVEIAGALEGRYQTLDIPLLDISSTLLRHKLRAGLSLCGLMPQPILDRLTAADLAALTHHENTSTH
jgi:nicotinate-nucleotide adenylyltransferase